MLFVVAIKPVLFTPVDSAAVLGATKEIRHIVAVPESFLSQPLSILNMDAPSDAELTELVLGTPSDPEHPS